VSDSRKCAVAVRDGVRLFLAITVCRATEGDIYFEWPGGGPHLEPHASWHASGQIHHKAVDRRRHPGLMSKPYMVRHGQKPDESFVGTEPFFTTNVSVASARRFNQTCDPADFAEVLEIPAELLSPGEGRVHNLSFDLTAATELPIVPPAMTAGTRVLYQRVIQDRLPWIVLSVLEEKGVRPR
jgi:hypothetical protein